MRITIARSLLDQILAEAAASPDKEVCGLLLGDEEAISEARPALNVADDPARAFELDPRALFAAFKAERSGGPKVIGHYHSHPSGSTEPSGFDADAAAPGSLWMIVAEGKAAFWMAEEGAGFRSVQLEIA